MTDIYNTGILSAKHTSRDLDILTSHMKQRVGKVGQSMSLVQTSIRTLMERPTQALGMVSRYTYIFATAPRD